MTDSSQTRWVLLIASFLVGVASTYAVMKLSPAETSSTEEPSNSTAGSLGKARDAAKAKTLVPLLDGTALDYFYEDGSGVHMDIYNGMLKYEWIRGIRTGNGNKDLKYTSREIGDDVYLVSWLEASHPDYTSLIFDFKSRRMYSTGIFRFGTANQFTRFDEGRIENPTLVEHGQTKTP